MAVVSKAKAKQQLYQDQIPNERKIIRFFFFANDTIRYGCDKQHTNRSVERWNDARIATQQQKRKKYLTDNDEIFIQKKNSFQRDWNKFSLKGYLVSLLCVVYLLHLCELFAKKWKKEKERDKMDDNNDNDVDG